jgi:putative aldouronate transport system substrate-binding protein
MKKYLITVLSLIMMVGLFACSSNTNTGETNNEANKQNTTSDSKDNETTTTEPVTLRFVYKDENNANPVSVQYFDELEKALKRDKNLDVNIELVDLPQGNYAEKLTLLLYSGDIPDLIYFQGGDGPIAQQGLLEDLRPYIEKSEHLKNILEPYNEKRLENYPYLLWIKPLSPKIPVVRSDWFNQLDSSKALAENPSVDNYYAFFKELKEKQPGGSGKPSYGVTVAGNMAEINFAFDMAFGLNKTWLKKSDGTYEYGMVSQNQKEKLAFFNKLYSEGLLDPQYVTKQWDTKEKAFYDGEAGVIPGTAGKVIDIYNGKMVQVNGENAKLMVLPPAKGEYQGFGATDVTKESRGIAISSQSEHKDLVFEILDYLASPEGQKLDRLGFAGEHFNEVDGQIELTEKYYGEWYARFWEPSKSTFDMHLKTPLLSEPAAKSLELASTYFAEDNNFIIPEEYIANWDAMENLYKEYSTDIITGKRSISDFEKFVKEWYEAGGDQITKYANENIK